MKSIWGRRQVDNGKECLCMRLSEMKMKFSAALVSVMFSIVIAIGTLTGGVVPARGEPFPTYGTGPIQVRIYTDYFCPPCRAMEPEIEPLLRKLIDRGIITLTLVDTPFSKYSPLYARYFLYAQNRRDSFEHALTVRNTLFEAAANRHFTTKERIEGLFKSKGIPFTEFDPARAFDRYNALIKEDHVDATPSCVIMRSVRKEKFVGGPDIIKALKGLQP